MTRSIKYLMLFIFTVIILQTVSCYTQIAMSPRSTISRDRDEQYEYWERNHRHIRYYYPDCFDCYPWDYYYYSPYWYDYDYYHPYDRDRYSDDETVREIPSRRETLPGRRGTAAEISTTGDGGTTTHYYRESESSRSSAQSSSSSSRSSSSSSSSTSSSATTRTRNGDDNSDDEDDNNEDKTRSIPSRRTR